MTDRAMSSLQPEWLVAALCPAIAVSTLATSSIGLGLAACAACVLVTLASSLMRSQPWELRWPLCMLLLAASLSAMDLWTHAWLHELHGSIGVFLPLLAANLGIHLQMERSAASPPLAALSTGLRAGVTILIVLIVLAVARELVGHGSLLHDAATLVGNRSNGAGLQLFRADMGFLLAVLPPGAFIAFGLLLAARNLIEPRRHEQEQDH